MTQIPPDPTLTGTQAHTYTHTHTHTHTHTQVQVHALTHMHPPTDTCTHAHALLTRGTPLWPQRYYRHLLRNATNEAKHTHNNSTAVHCTHHTLCHTLCPTHSQVEPTGKLGVGGKRGKNKPENDSFRMWSSGVSMVESWELSQ